MVAGRLFAPTLVLLALAVAPFVDRNPSIKPGDRKLAITLFTMLIMFGAVLTIIGSFFRGTGYNWVWPWSPGALLRAMTPMLAISERHASRSIVAIVVIDLFAIFFGAVVRSGRGRPSGRRDAAARRRHHGRARAAGAQAREPSRASSAASLARRRSCGVRRRVRRRNDRVPVAEPQGRVRIGDQRRQARRHPRVHQGQQPARSTSGTGRFYIVRYAGDAGRATIYATEGVTTRRDHAAVPALRAPRVPRPVLPVSRSGSSARATARSTTPPASTSSARPRTGWTGSRCR